MSETAEQESVTVEYSITQARELVTTGMIALQSARDAVETGEAVLGLNGMALHAGALAALATSHFTAATAICDVLAIELLSEPPLQLGESGHLE